MQQKIQENHFEKKNTACRLWRPKQLRKKRRLYDSAEDIAERLPKDNPECQKFLATLFTYLGNVRCKPQELFNPHAFA